jgi:hypothetical protein
MEVSHKKFMEDLTSGKLATKKTLSLEEMLKVLDKSKVAFIVDVFYGLKRICILTDNITYVALAVKINDNGVIFNEKDIFYPGAKIFSSTELGIKDCFNNYILNIPADSKSPAPLRCYYTKEENDKTIKE